MLDDDDDQDTDDEWYNDIDFDAINQLRKTASNPHTRDSKFQLENNK